MAPAQPGSLALLPPPSAPSQGVHNQRLPQTPPSPGAEAPAERDLHPRECLRHSREHSGTLPPLVCPTPLTPGSYQEQLRNEPGWEAATPALRCQLHMSQPHAEGTLVFNRIWSTEQGKFLQSLAFFPTFLYPSLRGNEELAQNPTKQ